MALTALQIPWLVAGGLLNPCALNWLGMKTDVGCPEAPTAASASVKLVVGRKPPWNQPQDRPALLSSSPMFLPDIATASRVEQSSQYGWASPVSEKPPFPSAVMSPFGAAAVETVGLLTMCVVSTPPVLPEARLIAPGVDGPNVVPKELSLIAYRCA